MSIKNKISAIVDTLSSKPAFVYGLKNELNTLADDVNFKAGRSAVFMLAITKENGLVSIAGGRKASFEIYLEFLKQTEFEQFSDEDELIVEEMRTLKNEFLSKLYTYQESGNTIFNFKAGDTDTSNNIFDKYDAGITGVTLEISLSEAYKNSFCDS